MIPVYAITPLCVPGNRAGIENLEDYRKATRVVVDRRQDRNLHLVEGLSLRSPVIFNIFRRDPNCLPWRGRWVRGKGSALSLAP